MEKTNLKEKKYVSITCQFCFCYSLHTQVLLTSNSHHILWHWCSDFCHNFAEFYDFSDFLKVYLLTDLRTSGQAARWEQNMQKWEAIQRRRQP